MLLEKLGFDELFIGEHYSAATEPFPSPLMFAASLLTRPSGSSSAPASSMRRCIIRR